MLEGGVGRERGGRLERSSERVGRDERDEPLEGRLEMVVCSVMLAMLSIWRGWSERRRDEEDEKLI